MWALAVMGQCYSFAIDKLVDRLCSIIRDEPLHKKQLMQVHQYILSCQLDGDSTRESLALQPLRDKICDEAAKAFAATPSVSSKMQDAVVRSLQATFPGVVTREEAVDGRSGYDLDALLDAAAVPGLAPAAATKQWVLEVDGPSHFLRPSSPTSKVRPPTGNTVMKRRLLQLLEYELIIVPYWEWDDVRLRDQAGQRKYWQDKFGI